MSERVIGKKSMERLSAETDAWLTARDSLTKVHQGETVATLAVKWGVNKATTRGYLAKLKAQGRVKVVGYNSGKSGGKVPVYQLVAK